jgi:hypothetical protein
MYILPELLSPGMTPEHEGDGGNRSGPWGETWPEKS